MNKDRLPSPDRVLDWLSSWKIYLPLSLTLLTLLGIIFWPGSSHEQEEKTPASAKPIASGLVLPIETPVDINPQLANLGQKLFSDRRLSRDETVACESCHNLSAAGTDGRPHSVGIDGQLGKINAPTIFNATFNFRQFWDGRASSLEAQAEGPVVNPIEMGFTWPELVERLKQDDAYQTEFRALFPDGLTASNIRIAIVEFERTLVTPNASFDRYLKGDMNALSKVAQDGYQLFQEYGCIACHQGRNFGGSMYEKLGAVRPYYGEHRPPKPEDLGRYNITQDPEHKYEFKVPSLRNVARTAPYFHNGSIETLDEVVRLMARHQLGIELTDAEASALVAFLESLTGEYAGRKL